MNHAKRTVLLILGLALVVMPVGAGEKKKRKDQPDVIVVQHILVGFKKSVRGKQIDRTKKQAEALAEELLERARSGELPFDELVEEFTDDRYPGIYKMTNTDVPLMDRSFARRDMAINFGDVAFQLEVGEVGLARYHPGNSPFGWHVILRLE
jgi:hypothetical protein